MKTYKNNRICPTDNKKIYIHTVLCNACLHDYAQKSFNLAHVKEFDFYDQMENISVPSKGIIFSFEKFQLLKMQRSSKHIPERNTKGTGN